MMSRFIYVFCVLLAAWLMQSTALWAQEKRLVLQARSQFKVLGTSTLHDWHMETSVAEGFLECLANEGEYPTIKEARVTLKAKDLKSGKKGMDKNAYKALYAEKYPIIEFRLQNLSIDETGRGKALGTLFLAGTSREVSFTVELQYTEGILEVTGRTAFRLTDFNIEPPTALMGTIKTGDDVTIEFNTTFKTL
ncbi:YceI family protein [Roseivirga sp. UBA1976]|uniref:YceI family protein n=1 Tax=Roseivirga sp. UBA1976 TaxID=1947386 RepID=UPI00257EFD66|nr:YceI family protein [Roseivirga sp. UBA1976]